MNGPTRHDQGFALTVDARPLVSPDPVPLGRQLLSLAGKSPIDEHLLYLLTKDRLMEDIGLEEPVDLREPGRETFLTFKSDRSFRFELNGRRQDWGAPVIAEGNLLMLAGVDMRNRVWLERRDQPDRQIERGELVELTGTGIERFYTRRELTVTVVNEDNGDEFTLEGQQDTGLETLIAKMYVQLKVARQPDDRLRCESTKADVFPFASLTLEEYLRKGHCQCLVWLFAGGTGGAACR